MKILNLHFKNLNSLYGEWKIDFTAPEYVSDGLFALTGPTGSGKSTILDAICLALYGATPRLGLITQNKNEIMSRGKGDCFAEVTFQSQEGIYTCRWEQNRARKNANGNLQQPEHTIFETKSGKVLENKKSLTLKKVEEKTGMDFERFTRSILLAQGAFDQFLKASTDQKSKILEQITGTALYTKISIKVYERQKEEKKKLDDLSILTGTIQLIDSDEELRLREQLKTQQQIQKKSQEELKTLQNQIDWHLNIQKIKNNIQNYLHKKKSIEEKEQLFLPKLSILEQTKKAALIQNDYVMLNQLLNDQKENIQSQNQLREQINNIAELLTASKKEKDMRAELLAQKKKEVAIENQKIERARSLDQVIQMNQKEYEKIQRRIVAIQEKCEELIKNIEQSKEKKDKCFNQQIADNSYLKSHSADEILVEKLTGFQSLINEIIANNNQINQLKNELSKICNQKKELEGNYLSLQKSEAVIVNKNEHLIERLNILIEQYTDLSEKQTLADAYKEKDYLLKEKSYLLTIQSLEEHRKQLESGKPCPLCGATEHPFALNHLPVMHEVDTKIEDIEKHIAAFETLTKQKNKLETEKDKMSLELKTCQDALHYQKIQLSEFVTLSSEKEKQINLLNEEISNKTQALNDALSTFKIKITDVEALPELIESLTIRKETWQKKYQSKLQIDTEINQIDNQLLQYQSLLDESNAILKENKKELEEKTVLLNEKTIERKSMLSQTNLETYQEKLNAELTQADLHNQDAIEKHQKTDLEYTQVQSTLREKENALTGLKTKIKRAEDKFITALNQQGFFDEAAFLSALKNEETLQALQKEYDQIQNQKNEMTSNLKYLNEQQGIESKKKLTPLSLEILQEKQINLDQEIAQHREVMIHLKHQLEENEKQKIIYAERREKLEKQKEVLELWNTLFDYIGSSDGKKYRNFAQSLTFEVLIQYANAALRQINDRYSLIQAEESLTLNVIDHYQAEEIRSILNLSGGESFIVSLALALGLSKMSSQKVRVDSLFLDEGFGTLDEETLEAALSALSNLYHEGKLIGIISHISALKNRIRTQITVSPEPGGRSLLSGPGCYTVR